MLHYRPIPSTSLSRSSHINTKSLSWAKFINFPTSMKSIECQSEKTADNFLGRAIVEVAIMDSPCVSLNVRWSSHGVEDGMTSTWLLEGLSAGVLDTPSEESTMDTYCRLVLDILLIHLYMNMHIYVDGIDFDVYTLYKSDLDQYLGPLFHSKWIALENNLGMRPCTHYVLAKASTMCA